jgi:hypothetical protein
MTAFSAYQAITDVLLDRSSLNGSEDAARQKEERGDEVKDASYDKAHQPEGQQKKPDERI